MMRKIFSVFTVALVAALFCGCGTKVRARHMAPAKFPVAGIHALAVPEFNQRGLTMADWGERISERIASELKQSDFFTVVSGYSYGRSSDSLDELDPAWARGGKELNVDAVLVGVITDIGVTTDIYHRKETHDVPTGRYRTESYIQDGQMRHRRVEIIRKETEFIPVVTKRGRLNLKVALFELLTGGKLHQETYRETKTERKEGELYGRDIISNEDMLDRLADRVVSRVVKDLVPHPVVEKIKLLGEAGCKEGVTLAKEGQWTEAEQSWQSLLTGDPTNHAAHYNLGVAAEVAGRYDQAEQHYLEAMELTGKKLYKEAWERANALSLDKEKLDEQMQGR